MKTLIGIPCMDMVHTGFFKAFTDLNKAGASYTVLQNTLIHDSRNIIAANAIKAGFDRIMWFDSDMTFEPDTLERLSADMDTGLDFVTGVYYTRKPPKIRPVIYKELWWDLQENGEVYSGATNFTDYPEGIFEIAGAGFGCCLTSVDLIKRVGDEFGSPFAPIHGMGEDLSFCWRVQQIGAKMYCDGGVQCGHIGQFVYNKEWK